MSVRRSADYAGPPEIEEDYLTLSTVHTAKGLEWRSVHVIGASDGNFPSDMALTSPEGLEEERRLFYVALTRTCVSLSIYVPVTFYHRPGSRDDTHGYGISAPWWDIVFGTFGQRGSSGSR